MRRNARSERSLDNLRERKAKVDVGEKEKEKEKAKADVKEVVRDHSVNAGDLERREIPNALNHGLEDMPITEVDRSCTLPKCRTRRNI